MRKNILNKIHIVHCEMMYVLFREIFKVVLTISIKTILMNDLELVYVWVSVCKVKVNGNYSNCNFFVILIFKVLINIIF